MATSTLSPRRAVFFGLLFMACGVVPILAGLGVIPAPPSANPAPTPPWLVICAGVTFVLAGAAVIVDYGIAGGLGPDGGLRADASVAVRGLSLLLALAIVGLMTLIAGWIAFGPGPRAFTMSISLPFMTKSSASNDVAGRVAFGAATLLLAFMFVSCGIVGIRRLSRR